MTRVLNSLYNIVETPTSRLGEFNTLSTMRIVATRLFVADFNIDFYLSYNTLQAFPPKTRKDELVV